MLAARNVEASTSIVMPGCGHAALRADTRPQVQRWLKVLLYNAR